MSQALDDYMDDFRRLSDFERDNAELLARHKQLQENLAESDFDLKAHARIFGPEENDTIAVKVNAAPKKRYWDADILLQKLDWLGRVPGIIIKTVDDKALMRQLKTSKIPESAVKDALTVTEGTVAVSIRVKTPEVRKAEVTA